MRAEERSSVIIRVLARYLRTNPNACDTAAGIARWWVPLELEAAAFEVLPLLECFTIRGLLEKFSTVDGRMFYRRRVIDALTDAALEQLSKESNEMH